MYNLENFQKGLRELNITLPDMQMQQFLIFYEMLAERNKVMNLTAITEFDEVVEKHFLDSLCLVKAMPELLCNRASSDVPENSVPGKEIRAKARRANFTHPNVELADDEKNLDCPTKSGEQLKKIRFLDLGTGAGFPGIPLKIAFPYLNIVLLDSLNKRIQFLNDVIGELGMTNITAVHGRAEELARKPEFRQQFDVCLSRAVANLASLSEYCLPFVKIGGEFISYKSFEVDEEVQQAKKAIFLMGGQTEQIVKFQLPASEQGRSLVCIRKKNGTPKAYPRKAGTPGKKPIL